MEAAFETSRVPTVTVKRTEAWNHLPQLLQHQGEDPEVEHELRHPGPDGRRTEVQQEHVGEEEEEGKVHDDITQEDGDGSAPEAAPAAEQETPPALSCAASR